MRERSQRSEGILGALFDLLTGALGDVRAKLVDEGWFGRQAPSHDRAGPLGWGDGDRNRASLGSDPGANFAPESFEQAWAPRERSGPEMPAAADLDLER